LTTAVSAGRMRLGRERNDVRFKGFRTLRIFGRVHVRLVPWDMGVYHAGGAVSYGVCGVGRVGRLHLADVKNGRGGE